MKKILTLTALVSLAASFFSCTKEKFPQTQQVNNRNTSSLSAPEFRPLPPVIASNWFTLKLTLVHGGRDYYYLNGQHILENPLQANDDVRLAYVKIPSGTQFNFIQLPADINSRTGLHSFMFHLSSTSFDLNISHTNYTVRPDANEFRGCQYRYFVLPRLLYESLNIDWNNYIRVVSALNVTP